MGWLGVLSIRGNFLVCPQAPPVLPNKSTQRAYSASQSKRWVNDIPKISVIFFQRRGTCGYGRRDDTGAALYCIACATIKRGQPVGKRPSRTAHKISK